MARIPYYNPADTDKEKLALLGNEPQLNIFKIVTHAPTEIARQSISLPAMVLIYGMLYKEASHENYRIERQSSTTKQSYRTIGK